MDSPSFMKTIFLMHSCFVCLCSALGTFAYSHERIAQRWAAPVSSPIAWRSSVELEERMRRRTQTGRAFCCTSFGSSFLYDLSCRRKSLATLRSASRFGSSCPFSLKTAATWLRVLGLCFQPGEHHVVKKIVLDAQPRQNLR